MERQLKYEGIEQGTKIKAYDHKPGESTPDEEQFYLEGIIVGEDRSSMGARVYVVEVTKDNTFKDRDENRIGLEVLVPLEVAITDYDGRIEIIED